MSIRSYQDLEVWQQGMELAQMAYEITKKFPKEELFGMTSQIRRAAASVPANVAEGWAREGTTEFVHFLRIAKGSLRELETHLILSHRVNLLQESEVRPLLEVAEMLSRKLLALQRSLLKKKQ
ncbi:MAG: hypothetical protein BWY06_03230 [Candidatus Latescibacteria bacterium ADurb.Bin168]|nr:MAG: hypothetical protein BWY06_03230 [Candidatus Latescibacteria bacterium ADurb.Bin168]